MKAVGVRSLRAPIEVLDAPTPEVREDTLLLRMLAAGVNPFDGKVADGILSPARPHVFPLILGMDGAGVVERVGSRVREFTVGDRVFGDLIHDPIGEGTFAEWSLAPESAAMTRIPPGLDPVEAAAMPLAGMTALTALDALGLESRSTLLIVGASGGVGSFAIQLAASQGIQVLAAMRGSGGERLRALGAQEILDMGQGKVPEMLRAVHPQGVDGMLQLVGDAAAFRELSATVRRGGAAVTTTYAADERALAIEGKHGGNISLTPGRELLERLTTEVLAGRVKVPVEARATLEDGPMVLARSRAGELRGKVVLVP